MVKEDKLAKETRQEYNYIKNPILSSSLYITFIILI
jgi:hypothetical protein